MTLTRRPLFSRTALALVLLAFPSAAFAQDRLESFGRDVSGALGSIFGQGNSQRQETASDADSRMAQVGSSDLLMRIDALERQLRTLTGAIEQLQYRNQQLEQQVRRIEDEAGRGPGAAAPGAVRPSQQARPGAIPPPTVTAPPPAGAPTGRGRRNDAFDPTLHPNAPGAPQPLGSLGSRSDALEPGGEGPAGAVASAAPRTDSSGAVIISGEDPVGVPGGRDPGTPLDLTRQPRPAATPAAAPGPQVATLPPSQTPRDEFDFAYGYVMRKDYALAEDALRGFLAKYPSDRLAGEAQFWLGETLYQRKKYRDAADAFVAMAKKYEGHSKAPDALLRLGQSLAALNEKELACATFGEVTRKYPRASKGVKQMLEREQKRVRC